MVSNRTRRRPPDFAPSSETPGGFVGQAVLVLIDLRGGTDGTYGAHGDHGTYWIHGKFETLGT